MKGYFREGNFIFRFKDVLAIAALDRDDSADLNIMFKKRGFSIHLPLEMGQQVIDEYAAWLDAQEVE
jgi:hypothetical protein